MPRGRGRLLRSGARVIQYSTKMAEVVFKRSIHQLPFAFFAPSRELIGEDTNTVSREEREAAKSGLRVPPTPRYRILRGCIAQCRVLKTNEVM